MDTAFEKIVSIEEFGDVETYDLEVDSEFHNYYANDVCVSNSHSLSYSYVAMQTLYLKRYYPTEFYTALLNHQKSSSDKDEEKAWLAATILAAMSKGIEIVPPTRISEWDWTMVEEGKVAMGLSSIGGFGIAAYEELVKKEFSKMSRDDFFATKLKAFNKTSFEACLKVGLFDDWSKSREEITQWRDIKIKDKAQLDIFGNVGLESKTYGKTYKSTTEEQKYSEFMEVCNLDLKLLQKIAGLRKMFYDEYNVHIEPFTNFDDDKRFYYFCLNHVEERTSQKGTKFFSLTLSDGAMTKRVNMWRDMYTKHKEMLHPGSFYVTKFLKDKGWLSFNASAPFRKVL